MTATQTDPGPPIQVHSRQDITRRPDSLASSPSHYSSTTNDTLLRVFCVAPYCMILCAQHVNFATPESHKIKPTVGAAAILSSRRGLWLVESFTIFLVMIFRSEATATFFIFILPFAQFEFPDLLRRSGSRQSPAIYRPRSNINAN